MVFLIGLLTLLMVLDCLVLIFLVLIQLPKKDAGAGLAFGGSATDALFGAGSGTVLTKITKYAAGTFFILALVLSVMQSYFHGRSASAFARAASQPANASAAAPPTARSPLPSSEVTTSTPPLTNTTPLLLKPSVEATNLPVVPTNPVLAPAPTNPAPAPVAPK